MRACWDISRLRRVAFCVAFFTLMVHGCTQKQRQTTFKESFFNAWLMYSERDDVCGPVEHRRQNIEENDPSRFLSHMLGILHTEYRKQAIYSIAWFGDETHIDAIVPLLSAADEEERGLALLAFRRISGVEFETPQNALDWWQQGR